MEHLNKHWIFIAWFRWLFVFSTWVNIFWSHENLVTECANFTRLTYHLLLLRVQEVKKGREKLLDFKQRCSARLTYHLSDWARLISSQAWILQIHCSKKKKAKRARRLIMSLTSMEIERKFSLSPLPLPNQAEVPSAALREMCSG